MVTSVMAAATFQENENICVGVSNEQLPMEPPPPYSPSALSPGGTQRSSSSLIGGFPAVQNSVSGPWRIRRALVPAEMQQEALNVVADNTSQQGDVQSQMILEYYRQKYGCHWHCVMGSHETAWRVWYDQPYMIWMESANQRLMLFKREPVSSIIPTTTAKIKEESTYYRRRAFSESDKTGPRGRSRRGSLPHSPPRIRIPSGSKGQSSKPDSPIIFQTNTPQFFSTSRASSEESMALIESSNLSQESVRVWSRELISMWLEDGSDSYLAFEALLQLLEVALEPSQDNYNHFAALLDTLGPATISPFLREALPYLIDSDFQFHSDYVDILLLYLTLYQIHKNSPVLEDFVKENTEFGGLYLRQHGKRFQELFAYIHSNEERHYDEKKRLLHIKIQPHYLVCMHMPQKKVIVSNAPPIKLKRRRLIAREKFDCNVSAGGLVSGIKPSLRPQDVWVSYLDTKLLDLDRMPKHMVPRMIREGLKVAPKIRRSTSVMRYSFSVADSGAEDDYTEFLYEKAENDFMSLQRRLDRFAEQNFVVNPLIILKEEHKAFYNGISNGLFWPAFHNLPQYIVDEYRGKEGAERLAEDWQKYIKVNFHFAIHAARSCRQQDFLWIHDYHLFLVGGILRSLDPLLDCGFFLHIPFRVSDEFMAEFHEQGLSVLIGLLGFTRVGFQSNKDTLNFIHLVRKYVPKTEIENRAEFESLRFTIRHGRGGLSTDVGTFPISIKTDRLIEMISAPKMAAEKGFRQKIMRERDGKLFLSVERFDYTKGILERLDAIEEYLERYPERANSDVFYQIAAASRSDISSYKSYQSMVLEKVQELNEKYSSAESPIIIVDQSNQPQEIVFRLYQVADIGLVTPMADGMNLVIKEAILCNPQIILVLSTGAGAENQLFDAGLGDCYIRIEDISNKEEFAESLHRAVNIPDSVAASSGKKLYEYTRQHDIDYWIESFTNPDWTSQVVSMRSVKNSADLKLLRSDLRKFRKTITTQLDNDTHTGYKDCLSFQHCLNSLKNACHGSGCCDFLAEGTQVDVRHLMKGIERDIVTIKLGEDRSSTKVQWMDSCAKFSGLRKKEFDQERADLTELLRRVQPADLAICNSKILSTSESWDQTATSGFLLNRFLARFAVQTLVVSQTSLDELRAKSCFPENFSGGYCTADKFQMKHEGDAFTYKEPPENGIVDQLRMLFRKSMSMTNWLGRKIVVFGTHDDLGLVSWLTEKEGANVTLVSVDDKGDPCPENLTGRLFLLKDVEVLHAVAIEFILDDVFTTSYF